MIYLDVDSVEEACDRARALVDDWPECEWVDISVEGTRLATVKRPGRQGLRASG